MIKVIFSNKIWLLSINAYIQKLPNKLTTFTFDLNHKIINKHKNWP